jgi:hypothetical protein
VSQPLSRLAVRSVCRASSNDINKPGCGTRCRERESAGEREIDKEREE